MKYLPEKFPIRYAVHVDEQDVRSSCFNEPEILSSLWQQLIESLIRNPISEDHDALYYSFSQVRIYDAFGNKIANIAKLNPGRDWHTELGSSFKKLLPGCTVEYNEVLSSCFYLKLYSYKGMAEMPIFWKMINSANKKEVFDNYYAYSVYGFYEGDEKKRNNFIESFSNELSEYYSDIGYHTNIWEKYRIDSERFKGVSYIDIPYSNIWEKLDYAKEELYRYGTTISDPKIEKGDLVINADSNQNKITVAITNDIWPLLKEEIFAFHRVSNFCNSCGKILPFQYKGKYCPNIPKNKDCIRKRARIRKKK